MAEKEPTQATFDLYNGDCIDEMKQIADGSIDMIFVDLPYGQVSCAWDKKIDHQKMWVEFMRIKKLRTPIFMTCSTKFGAELIASAPKKCPFRWDIVWVKSSPVGFLSARKMPMRKHEMLYAFYEKLPLYDISSHTHKFLKKEVKPLPPTEDLKKDLYGRNHKEDAGLRGSYTPPLPVSVLGEEKKTFDDTSDGKGTYGGVMREKERGGKGYEPPLPVSVIKEENDTLYGREAKGAVMGDDWVKKKGGVKIYDPPLPVSVMNELKPREPNIYGKINNETAQRYEPPLPVSVLKEETGGGTGKEDVYGFDNRTDDRPSNVRTTAYDPPLPVSVMKEDNGMIGEGQIYNGGKEMPRLYKSPPGSSYEPALPTSVQKEKVTDCYNTKERFENGKLLKEKRGSYDPPLPVSVVEEGKKGFIEGNTVYKGKKVLYRNEAGLYKPPLPVSVLNEENKEWRKGEVVAQYKPFQTKEESTYGKINVTTNYIGRKGGESAYEPPLPTSVNKEDDTVKHHKGTNIYHNQTVHLYKGRGSGSAYEPPLPTTVQSLGDRQDLLDRLWNPMIDEDYLNETGLPNSILEIKSQKGKHSTQKPLDLMKWCIKYFTKPGDVVLDNTMGSGSTGVAAKEMGRSFIGIELDPDIFEVACDRILD